MSKTYDLVEAAEYLRMSPAVLREKARLGKLKAAKPGKRWVFLEADLVEYLGALYASTRQAPLSGSQEVTWESTNAVIRGGSGLPPPAEGEYADLLGLSTNRQPKNCTTDSKRKRGAFSG